MFTDEEIEIQAKKFTYVHTTSTEKILNCYGISWLFSSLIYAEAQ